MLFSTGVATEDYLLLVGGGGWKHCLIPPLTIDNPPWLRPCCFLMSGVRMLHF